MDDLLQEFLTETNESLNLLDAELVRFEQDPNNSKILGNIFRLVHTIKGTCGFLGLTRLETLAHAAETLMGKFRDGMAVSADAVSVVLSMLDRIKAILNAIAADEREPTGSDDDLIDRLAQLAHRAAVAPSAPTMIDGAPPSQPENSEQADSAGLRADERVEPVRADKAGEDSSDRQLSHSIRVNIETLDHLMTTVSELVLTRNQLLEIVRRHEASDFKAPLQRLSNVTAELQEGVMKTRMQPIGNAWQKLPRIVRALCTELGKDIELEMHGADTELDRQVLDLVKDPLTHLVRNCADHGIERPAERIAAGKSAKGKLRLSACHQGGHIIIEIADDGRGLNIAAIRAKAIEAGLVTEAELAAKSDGDVCNLIFVPGFSTAAEVTNISGRGVGMDVVRNNIEQIGGSVELQSRHGLGTTFTIKIPLTLAIVSALIVEAGSERFAVPQTAVLELVRAKGGGEHRIERINDTPVLRLRDKLLPLTYLAEGLHLSAATSGSEFVVVMQIGNHTFGVVVDAVVHSEEIVIKPMSSKLRHIAVFSGTTILGDGSVIMILDPNGLAQTLGRMAQTTQNTVTEVDSHDGTGSDEIVSLLVFRAGSQQQKAVPLSLITRLEEIDRRGIEASGSYHVVQYRGQLLPLLRVSPDTELKKDGAQPILVFSENGRSMGLIVDEIVDIVEERLNVEVACDRPGVLGYAVVKGATTEIVDVGHYLPLAITDWLRRPEQVSAGKRSILLVDDSPFFRDMLTPLIKAAGYRVVAVASATDALAVLKSQSKFDLIVTDVDMPGMDGFDLTEMLRAAPHTAHIPVIGLAAMVSQDAIERGRLVGFHDFVAKFDRAGLIAAIKEQSADFCQAA